MEKKTPSGVGRANKSNVLNLIKEQGPISRAAVAKTLKMSRSTISSIVDNLIREGRIYEGVPGQSTSVGGRKPVNLHYISTAKYALGVDIGTSKTIAIITDLEGNIVYRKRFPSRVDGKPEMLHIRTELERILQEAHVPLEHILGTGLGFPGITLVEQGCVADSAKLNLHDFQATAFFKSLPCPISIDNDVNMAVIGERWLGAATKTDNVILVAIGTGIGAGLLLNGRVYRGAEGFAGEIGYLQTNPTVKAEKVTFSEFGPLEYVGSGKGMQEVARARLSRYPKSVLQQGELTAERLFAAMFDGDPLATEVVGEAISHLSFAIAGMVTLLNPGIVILGGGVSRMGDPLISRIRQGVERLTPMRCEIVAAGLGEDAGAFGSAATVLMRSGELRMHGFDDWSMSEGGGTM